LELLALSVLGPQPAKFNVCACQKREKAWRKKIRIDWLLMQIVIRSPGIWAFVKSLSMHTPFLFFSETDATLILFKKKMTGN
jgi:hypothetical protein